MNRACKTKSKKELSQALHSKLVLMGYGLITLIPVYTYTGMEQLSNNEGGWWKSSFDLD